MYFKLLNEVMIYPQLYFFIFVARRTLVLHDVSKMLSVLFVVFGFCIEAVTVVSTPINLQITIHFDLLNHNPVLLSELTHFSQVSHFYTPENVRKTFSGGIEM